MKSSNQNNQDISNNPFFTKESILTANTGKEVKNMQGYTTIKEISNLFKVNEITVRRAIKELFPDNLKKGFITYLNEIETAQIKDFMFSNKYLGKVNPESIDRSVDVIVEAEMYEKSLEVMKWMSSKLKELNNKIEQDKPKVENYEKLLSAKNSMTMNEVAKAIDWGRNKLFDFLREEEVLMKDNLPRQRYIDAGYFKVRFNAIQHSDYVESKPQPLVTPKGIEYILSLLNSAQTKLLTEV